VSGFITAVRFRVEWLAALAVRLTLRALPMSAVRALGHGMGRTVYLLDRHRRHIALENLTFAFPGRSARDRKALARAMFAHFGAVLLELIKFGTYSREQMLAATEVEGEERFLQARRQGRGVLFFTGHFGYWEMQAITHAITAEPISALARPLDNPLLHAMLEDIRTRTGNTVIYRQGALRRMLRELTAGRGIAVLIDQHLHTDAVTVGFFRRPAATTSALAALALRTGAPVIPVFALPLPHGRYRFIYEHPVDPPRAGSPDAVREFTQRCTDVLEMYVRRHPELWMWMHRRWRDDPDRGSGTGDRGSGTGDRGSGTGDRGSGTEDWGLDTEALEREDRQNDA
jgi:KDO2-lipid IV(A) lauroyltransferase